MRSMKSGSAETVTSMGCENGFIDKAFSTSPPVGAAWTGKESKAASVRVQAGLGPDLCLSMLLENPWISLYRTVPCRKRKKKRPDLSSLSGQYRVILSRSCPHFAVDTLFSLLTSDKCHLKGLAGAMLLEAIRKGEGIIHFIMLKYIKTSIQRDFPAVVSHYVTGMDCPGCIEFP